MGFPRGYKVCHRSTNRISDMGAPTYWRLARLSTQMTDSGTRDTTQEPENNGSSIVVLASIQSGYSEEAGAKCNLNEGYYTDEETSLLATGVLDWIRAEITQMNYFDRMYNIERDGLRKVINQRVTTPNPRYPTPTPISPTTVYTTAKTEPVPDAQLIDVIQFDPEDEYDPTLIEELNRFKFDYPDQGPEFYPTTNSSAKPRLFFTILFSVTIILNLMI